MIKSLTYLSLILVLTSCKISGTYRWLSLNTKLNPTLIEHRDRIVRDSNLIYYDNDVSELQFKKFGKLTYRFSKAGNEGSVYFSPDLPLNKGKWELKNDTLFVYHSVEKSGSPYLYKINGDTLVPINNKIFWKKEK